MMTKEQFEKLPKEQQDAIMKEVEKITKATSGAEEKALPQLSMDEFKNMVNGLMEKHMKTMTEVDKRYFAFPGIGNDPNLLNDNTAKGKFVKSISFLKALVGGDAKTCRALSDEVRQKASYGNEATGSEGAYLVPEEFAAEVLRLAPEYGVARRECRLVPMRYDVMNFPSAGTTDVSAHWTNEASQIYGTFPSLGQVILTIKKLATLPKASSELLADANVDVVQYLSMLIAEAFARQEDLQAFIGTGSPFVGAINATGVPSYAHEGTGIQCLSYQDLAILPGKLYPAAAAGAKLYIHRTMKSHVQSLITTAGAPIFPNVGDSILGYPIVPVEILPGIGHTAYRTDALTYAIFGNFKMGMLMGERGTLEMKMTDTGVVGADNLFEKDMVALRVIERICFGVALPSAFIKISS